MFDCDTFVYTVFLVRGEITLNVPVELWRLMHPKRRLATGTTQSCLNVTIHITTLRMKFNCTCRVLHTLLRIRIYMGLICLFDYLCTCASILFTWAYRLFLIFSTVSKRLPRFVCMLFCVVYTIISSTLLHSISHLCTVVAFVSCLWDGWLCTERRGLQYCSEIIVEMCTWTRNSLTFTISTIYINFSRTFVLTVIMYFVSSLIFFFPTERERGSFVIVFPRI